MTHVNVQYYLVLCMHAQHRFMHTVPVLYGMRRIIQPD